MILGGRPATSKAGAQTCAVVRFGGNFEPITAIAIRSQPGVDASFAFAEKTPLVPRQATLGR